MSTSSRLKVTYSGYRKKSTLIISSIPNNEISTLIDMFRNNQQMKRRLIENYDEYCICLVSFEEYHLETDNHHDFHQKLEKSYDNLMIDGKQFDLDDILEQYSNKFHLPEIAFLKFLEDDTFLDPQLRQSAIEAQKLIIDNLKLINLLSDDSLSPDQKMSKITDDSLKLLINIEIKLKRLKFY